MPELPDVEVSRQYLVSTALNQPISAVHVGGDKNKKILEGIDPQRLGREVVGRSFKDAHRYGKYCFAELSNGNYLVLHFGMTGFLRYYKNKPDNLSHTRVRFSFKNGYHLAFVDQRLLGALSVVSDPHDFIREKQLGPDALDGLSEAAFLDIIDKSHAKIKTLLTDQQKMAGIGNVYADEILFQARIHPITQANLLHREERRRLYRAVHKVLVEAIQTRADPQQMPETYLLPVRKKGGECPRCNTLLRKMKMQGRGTYFCPSCQKA